MIRWLNRFIATMQLMKWQEKIASEYDVVQEVQKLVDAGFQYERALAIINAIANYSNHERNGTSCQNK